MFPAGRPCEYGWLKMQLEYLSNPLFRAVWLS